jgi:cysteinyl-tRNA synthetase
MNLQMIRLYNTLVRQKQDFTPIKDDEVKLYTCGPTVYDYAHIGNLRSFVFDDTLRRMLQSAGYQVNHVMNITDVGHLSSDADEGEDKLEKGAQRESQTVWEVAQRYIDAFKDDIRALNILEPNGNHGVYARATDFISQQIDIVKLLIDKGFAYQTDNAVFFDVTKLDDYGKLTGQKLADKEVGARDDVVVDNQKRHPQDFALWFFKVGRFADHSMSWPSPWGDGFPGWHLECSAIIHATLGEPIDIHTGGVDHIGTHHTNEIAQTEAAYDVNLANYWLHNEHLLADSSKMSKSKDNYFTLKDVKDKGFNPLALRLLFLQSHYRSQSNFSWEAMEAAQTALDNIYAWSDLRFQAKKSMALKSEYEDSFNKIKDSLEDDLSTPEAIGILNGMINRAEELGADSETIADYAERLEELLGLGLSDRQDITAEQKNLIVERDTARENQDWQTADKLRQKLLDEKIEVKDTAQGSVWRRK